MRWKVEIPEDYTGSQHHWPRVYPEAMAPDGLVFLRPEMLMSLLDVDSVEKVIQMLKFEGAICDLRPEYAQDLKARLEREDNNES